MPELKAVLFTAMSNINVPCKYLECRGAIEYSTAALVVGELNQDWNIL